MKPKDRDIVLTKDDQLLLVFGYFNEQRIYGFPKYLPLDILPEDLKKRPTFAFLGKQYIWTNNLNVTPSIYVKEKNPEYWFFDPNFFLDKGFGAKPEWIKTIYNPQERLKTLKREGTKSKAEDKLLDLCSILESSAGISSEALGITSSFLVGGGVNKYSDIDLAIYGRDNFERVIGFIPFSDRFVTYSKEDWCRYYERCGIRNRFKMDFETFYLVSRHKVDRFCFESTDISLFNIRNDEEISNKPIDNSELVKSIEIECTIKEDRESSFRPSKYLIDEVTFISSPKDEKYRISEIASVNREWQYHVFKGDRVRIKGQLQKCWKGNSEFYRMLLGSEFYGQGIKLEDTEEFFIKL